VAKTGPHWTGARYCGVKSPKRPGIGSTRRKKPIPKFLSIRTSIESGKCTVLNHDFVSDGFLALVAAGLLLLCSSLLVVAFA
jgi:hypothetical protein